MQRIQELSLSKRKDWPFSIDVQYEHENADFKEILHIQNIVYIVYIYITTVQQYILRMPLTKI